MKFDLKPIKSLAELGLDLIESRLHSEIEEWLSSVKSAVFFGHLSESGALNNEVLEVITKNQDQLRKHDDYARRIGVRDTFLVGPLKVVCEDTFRQGLSFRRLVEFELNSGINKEKIGVVKNVTLELAQDIKCEVSFNSNGTPFGMKIKITLNTQNAENMQEIVEELFGDALKSTSAYSFIKSIKIKHRETDLIVTINVGYTQLENGTYQLKGIIFLDGTLNGAQIQNYVEDFIFAEELII